MTAPVSFPGFWRQSALSAVLAGTALGVLLVVLALFVNEGSAHVDVELSLDLATALWSLLLIPLVLVLVFSLLAPLSYALYRLGVRATARTGRNAGRA